MIQETDANVTVLLHPDVEQLNYVHIIIIKTCYL